MASAMIPFAIAYVYGFNRLLRGAPALVLAVVGGIVIAITASEFFANSIEFASAYNWFHM